MKKRTKLSAAALAGLMALSMTACGAASDTAYTPDRNASSYSDQESHRNNNVLQPKNSTSEKNGILHRNGPAANGKIQRDGDKLEKDIKDTARDAADRAKELFDSAVDNGRVSDSQHNNANRNTVQQKR